jgi:hypothetical protein
MIKPSASILCEKGVLSRLLLRSVIVRSSECATVGHMIATLEVRPPGAGEPSYEVVLSAERGWATEEVVRNLVQHSRGQLKRLVHSSRQRQARLHLHLGRRRIDDVLTALEGAGFSVDAVIATSVG